MIRKSILRLSVHHPIWPGLLLLPLAILSVAITCGQEVGDAQDEAEGEETIVLDMFEVSTSQDRGYLSTNATSGTSLNMAIRDLPMPLEVINQEMIEDLQATDVREALQYSAGITTRDYEIPSATSRGTSSGDRSPSSAGNLDDGFTNVVNIRGYNVPNQQRLGFRVGAIVPAYGVVLGGTTDTVNTSRLEVVRGPSSLLYGINVLSGIVNVIPKKPLSEPRYSASVSGGNFGYMRATFDATGPLIREKLNYRILGSIQENGNWTDDFEQKQNYFAAQAEWFITSNMKLLLEYQKSHRKDNGIGSQFLVDAAGGVNSFFFRNEFDERYTYGRDFTEDVADEFLVRRPDKTYSALEDLGPAFRITGADTYRERDEDDFLALLTLQPTENLNIEAGVYFTRLEDEEFDVDYRVTGNTDGPVAITRPSTFRTVDWFFNPEADREDLIPFIDNNGNSAQFGAYTLAMELFRVPNAERLDPNRDFGDEEVPKVETGKIARYLWYKIPTTADSTQARLRAAYAFDSDFFNFPISHTVTLGAQYTRDKVSLVSGGVGADRSYAQNPADRNAAGRQDADAWHARNLLDLDPLKYQNEELAIPGTLNENDLPGLFAGNVDDGSVIRSGWREAELTFEGYYGVYQGQFLGKRGNLILGARRDVFQVKETEFLRIIDRGALTDVYTGSPQPITPFFAGDASSPYQWNPQLPDALNQQVENDIEILRQGFAAEGRNGTQEYNFLEDFVVDTGTVGLSFRIIDPVSVYVVATEGVFPNTGQRDGLNRPIGPEKTKSTEIGLKFDLFDRKISGTISAFRINRENAVWDFADAPAPARWFGGAIGPQSVSTAEYFDPYAALEGTVGQSGKGGFAPLMYAVHTAFVAEAYGRRGLPVPTEGQDGIAQPGGLWSNSDNYLFGVSRSNYLRVNYEFLREQLNAFAAANGGSLEALNARDPGDAVYNGVHPMVEAFEKALRAGVEFPRRAIDYRSDAAQGITLNNNPSHEATRGANVLYEEEANGFDGQLIFSPLPNYQIVFTFSHIERGVTGSGFALVDPVVAALRDSGYVDPEIDTTPADDMEPGSGRFATRYDAWVGSLGIENFADPADPTSLTGGTLAGTNLSFIPENQATLWNKYRFESGPVKGLELGGGVRYSSSVQSTLKVGNRSGAGTGTGDALVIDPFPPPDIGERFVLDTSFSYTRKLGNVNWRLSLKVDNVLDDTRFEEVAEYANPFTGGTELRRTRIYYAPRSFRLSLTADF